LFALLTHIQKLTSSTARFDQQQSIPVVATTAAHAGTAALTPPIDSLNDDNDQPASDVVDFTPLSKVAVSEPFFKTQLVTLATRSVSFLTPPLQVDKFGRFQQPRHGFGCESVSYRPTRNLAPAGRP
jgi:hypothetical protein